mmetsp:Transcript_4157/g.10122  ORF Transcript_4157/g.10122 Transcript_4157/m.10122 type:complete len:239 (-) Transcript_4157:1787-2503(-)
MRNQGAAVGLVRLIDSVQEISFSRACDIPHIWGPFKGNLRQERLALRKWWESSLSHQRFLESLVRSPPRAPPTLSAVAAPARVSRTGCCCGAVACNHGQRLRLALELQEIRSVLRQEEVFVGACWRRLHGLDDVVHNFLEMLVRTNVQAKAVLPNHQNVHPRSPHWIHEITRAQVPQHCHSIARHGSQLLHHLVQTPFLLDALHIFDDRSLWFHVLDSVHHCEKGTGFLLCEPFTLYV